MRGAQAAKRLMYWRENTFTRVAMPFRHSQDLHSMPALSVLAKPVKRDVCWRNI